MTVQQPKSNSDLRTYLFSNCSAVWIRPEDWFILKPFIRLNLIQTQGLSCSLAVLHMNLFQIWGLNFSLNVQQSTSILGLCTELLFLLFSNLNLNQTWWLIFFSNCSAGQFYYGPEGWTVQLFRPEDWFVLQLFCSMNQTWGLICS